MKANNHFINNPLPNEASKTDYEKQAELTKSLVTAAQNGNRNALERLCIFYEPLLKRCAGKFFITLSVMKKV